MVLYKKGRLFQPALFFGLMIKVKQSVWSLD